MLLSAVPNALSHDC